MGQFEKETELRCGVVMSAHMMCTRCTPCNDTHRTYTQCNDTPLYPASSPCNIFPSGYASLPTCYQALTCPHDHGCHWCRYEVYNWPWPFTNRDNVSRFRHIETDGHYIVFCESISNPCVPGTSSLERCWGRSICEIQPDPTTDGCIVKRVTIANPNAPIPNHIVNRVAPSTARSWMEKFRIEVTKLNTKLNTTKSQH